MSRAPDIADLEKMCEDGEGDQALCERAIEIFERLREEAKRARYSGNRSDTKRIYNEAEDFAKVITEIEKIHRHEHALDQFREYLKKQPH